MDRWVVAAAAGGAECAAERCHGLAREPGSFPQAKESVHSGFESLDLMHQQDQDQDQDQVQAHAPASGALLFFLGMSFGLLSAALAQNNEAEKLRTQLEESENKVGDLAAELGLRDSGGTKDLDAAKPVASRSCTGFGGGESGKSSKAADGDMSDIEAELEAQIELLELSVANDDAYYPDEVRNISTRALRTLVHLDPEYEADYATGEPRLQSDSDGGSSGASSGDPSSGNYAVSPKELSILLHELIQSELEAALLDSLERIHSLESDPLERNQDEYNQDGLDAGEEFEEAITMSKADRASPQPQDTPRSTDAESDSDFHCRNNLRYEQKRVESNLDSNDDELGTRLIEQL